jgi:hypothetical protein
MVENSSVPNFLVLLHCNLHDVQFLLFSLAAVLKRHSLDFTWLNQGPSIQVCTCARSKTA